jgi:hypothetical protein
MNRSLVILLGVLALGGGGFCRLLFRQPARVRPDAFGG